jgi:hypothetical protein
MKRKLVVAGIFGLSLLIGAAAVLRPKPVVTGSGKLHSISLLSDHADPDIVFVKVGEEVQFNARDGKSHNISQGESIHQHSAATDAAQSPGKESGTFGSTEGYRVAFRQAGTFLFHDTLNDSINVTVVAYETSSSASPVVTSAKK